MNSDDYDEEDDEEFDGPYPFPVFVREIECRPLTKYTLLNFASIWIQGFFRTGLEAFTVLGDAVLGAEGYKIHQKDFADEIRAGLESLPTAPED